MHPAQGQQYTGDTFDGPGGRTNTVIPHFVFPANTPNTCASNPGISVHLIQTPNRQNIGIPAHLSQSKSIKMLTTHDQEEFAHPSSGIANHHPSGCTTKPGILVHLEQKPNIPKRGSLAHPEQVPGILGHTTQVSIYYLPTYMYNVHIYLLEL